MCNDTNNPARIGLTRRQAKRAHPWGQYYLGGRFADGYGVTESKYEATRWLRKAAAQWHPDALVAMSRCCFWGCGCTRDLSESQKYAKQALTVREGMTDSAREKFAFA